MLIPGSEIVLTIDKPVAGGRMLGRHEGQVVLAAGAIPAERVRVRIDRVSRHVAYGHAIEVIDADPDRRPASVDWACGGSVYAHIEYARQLALKAEIIADAFARIGKMTLPDRVAVASSPETGYRMRARLHVRGGRIGFFREGTHELCDPAATGQLLPPTLDVIGQIGEIVRREGLDDLVSVELAENIPADQRVLHLDLRHSRQVGRLKRLADVGGITGLTRAADESPGTHLVHGSPHLVDVLQLSPHKKEPPIDVRLQHHVRSFFQGNRWLLGSLVTTVLEQVPDDGVIDLYAGVGLFAVSLAALGRRSVAAVEGDRASVADLEANAAPYGDTISVRQMPVEDYLRTAAGIPDATIVLDPPRTGLSRDTVAGLMARRARRLVYVSCDVATLARDVRLLVDDGCRLDHLEAFDLFPNTAHVETLAVLRRVGGAAATGDLR